MIKILAMAGSTRTESFNKKILNHAVIGAREAGAAVTVVDLREYPLPIYDADLERIDGLSGNAKELQKIFLENQGMLFALPEYNSSISGVFKNAIDWISRPTSELEELACFDNKVCALMSASNGMRGGMRGLVHARSLLENIHVMVMPAQVCVGKAQDVLDQEGKIKDEKIRLSVEKLGFSLAELVQKINFPLN